MKSHTFIALLLVTGLGVSYGLRSAADNKNKSWESWLRNYTGVTVYRTTSTAGELVSVNGCYYNPSAKSVYTTDTKQKKNGKYILIIDSKLTKKYREFLR